MSAVGAVAVAIIEDNDDLRRCLALNLASRGFLPSAFADGAAFQAALDTGERWRVVVLDLGLPGEDGLAIAARLRTSHPEVGIIVQSGRGALAERIAGMNSGADIYLVKPTEMDELAAAIRSLTRRLDLGVAEVPAWKLNQEQMTIFPPDGKTIKLTYTETAILKTFARSLDCFSRHDELVSAMNKNPQAYDGRALEVAISRLRYKLGRNSPIRSVRTMGYVFAAKLLVVPPSEARRPA